MAKERVLIVVKTYPTLSKKYIELVCTAGFREDGSWIRIYPSPFRFLGNERQYRKYQWIELDLEKNPKDYRPESYRPRDIDNIKLLDFITTENAWENRHRLIIGNRSIYENLEKIITLANQNKMSLCVFKPSEILSFTAEKVTDEWDIDKKAAAEAALAQGSLFKENEEQDFEIARKLPYRFRYKFKDNTGKESSLLIEDWEIGQLYWNCLKNSSEQEAVRKVTQKYFDDHAKTKDLHFFLGTTREWHRRAKNPYVIIGTYYPPHQNQLVMF